MIYEDYLEILEDRQLKMMQFIENHPYATQQLQHMHDDITYWSKCLDEYKDQKYFNDWEKEFLKLTEIWQEGEPIADEVSLQMKKVEDLAILVDLYNI